VQNSENRRRWWSITPPPGPRPAPIGARRAYAEVLLAYGAFFAVGVIAAALLLGGRAKDLPDSGSWAIYLTQAVGDLTQIGLAVAVILLLGARRGVTPTTLGFSLPRRPDGAWAAGRTVRIVAWCMFALVLGGVVNAALQTGHLPNSTPNAPELIFGVVDSIQAGVIEELVVLAFVVVTLRQAGRPWWEVTAVALVLRGAYHIYYGPGVLGILVWAALYYWIYLRFRTLVPMMVCHAAWDSVGFLSQRWDAVATVGVLVVAVIWIAAPVLWLIERSNNRTVGVGPWASGYGAFPGGHAVGYPGHPYPSGGGGRSGSPAPSAGPPPGWHPDPTGVNRWRWWDGRAWTDHVSRHA
jgi:hypothetical protein